MTFENEEAVTSSLFEENDIVAISPDFSSFIEAFVTTPGGRPREIQGTMF